MRNETIYKGLKFKNNNLIFNNSVLFSFENNNIVDEYEIGSAIFNLKKYINNSIKKYISESIVYNITKNEGLITLELRCKESDGWEYKESISFVSFMKNSIIYL